MKPSPSTETQLQVVIFTLAKECYAIPVAQVREVTQIQSITPLPQTPAFIAGVIILRDRIFAVTDLRTRLGYPPRTGDEEARILVVRLPEALVGLIVDDVNDVIQIPLQMVQPAPAVTSAAQNCLSGIVRSDNRTIFLLSAQAIFSDQETHELARVRKHQTGQL